MSSRCANKRLPRGWRAGWLLAVMCAAGCAHSPPGAAPEVLRHEVEQAERAFAKTMADRDFNAFLQHVSAEAVFFGGGVKRGRTAVGEAWREYFDGAAPPFSWEPDQVEVLDSGTLALSTGPVRNAEGRPISRFNSIWRREADGRWRVIFDKGQPLPSASP